MKKIAVLFLLTIFVGSFTFAIEGIGDFNAALDVEISDLANNSPKNEDSKEPLGIGVEPSITYSRAFGALGLEAGLGDKLTIYLTDSAVYDKAIADELYLWVKPSYSLAAGPGTLAFDLRIKPTFYLAQLEKKGPDADLPKPRFGIDPHVAYSLDAGFGALAFDLGTDTGTESLVIYEGGGGSDDAGKAKYGLGVVPVYFKAGVTLPVGFNAFVKPVVGIATNDKVKVEENIIKTEFSKVVIGLGYQIVEIARADVDVTIPVGNEDNWSTMKYAGLTVAPKVTVGLDALEAYLGAEIGQIAADSEIHDSISVKLTLGASYSF
jgi:hypothetical protein